MLLESLNRDESSVTEEKKTLKKLNKNGKTKDFYDCKIKIEVIRSGRWRLSTHLIEDDEMLLIDALDVIYSNCKSTIDMLFSLPFIRLFFCKFWENYGLWKFIEKNLFWKFLNSKFFKIDLCNILFIRYDTTII